MSKSKWTRYPQLDRLWEAMPPSRKRITVAWCEVLIYTKEHGTIWKRLYALSNPEIEQLMAERGIT